MADAGRRTTKLLVPTLRVASVPEIHLETLLDDTLVHAIEPRAHPEMTAWIEAIRAEFKIYIVSNNPRRDRVELAALHLDLPFHHAAKKPSRQFFRRALTTMQLSPHEVAIVGDQLFTDVLGGNRLGAVTILVDPLSPERKWHRKMMRSVERLMLASQGTTYFTPKRPE
jgi:HAD superfamily phosphatase (TIGR01668 family)